MTCVYAVHADGMKKLILHREKLHCVISRGLRLYIAAIVWRIFEVLLMVNSYSDLAVGGMLEVGTNLSGNVVFGAGHRSLAIIPSTA